MNTGHNFPSNFRVGSSHKRASSPHDFFESGSIYDPALIDGWLKDFYRNWSNQIYSADNMKDIQNAYRDNAPATFGNSFADRRWADANAAYAQNKRTFEEDLVKGSMPYAHYVPGWDDLMEYMKQYQQQFGNNNNPAAGGGGGGTNFVNGIPNFSFPTGYHKPDTGPAPDKPVTFDSPGGYKNWYNYWTKNGVVPGSINPSTPYVGANAGYVTGSTVGNAAGAVFQQPAIGAGAGVGGGGNFGSGVTMSRKPQVGMPQKPQMPQMGQYSTSYGPQQSSLPTTQLPRKQNAMGSSKLQTGTRRNLNRNSPSQRRVR